MDVQSRSVEFSDGWQAGYAHAQNQNVAELDRLRRECEKLRGLVAALALRDEPT